MSMVFPLVTALTISVFAQSEEEEGINQTLQNIRKSTNLPIQDPSQSAVNETREAVPIQKNVTDLGANITEEAKDLVGNIGEGLKNLTK